jgi:hypothetical protein
MSIQHAYLEYTMLVTEIISSNQTGYTIDTLQNILISLLEI